MKNYNYSITWNEDDKLFVTKVPGRILATHASSPEVSLAKMKELLKDIEREERHEARLEIARQLDTMRKFEPLVRQDDFFVKLVGTLHERLTDADVAYLLKED